MHRLEVMRGGLLVPTSWTFSFRLRSMRRQLNYNLLLIIYLNWSVNAAEMRRVRSNTLPYWWMLMSWASYRVISLSFLPLFVSWAPFKSTSTAIILTFVDNYLYVIIECHWFILALVRDKATILVRRWWVRNSDLNRVNLMMIVISSMPSFMMALSKMRMLSLVGLVKLISHSIQLE